MPDRPACSRFRHDAETDRAIRRERCLAAPLSAATTRRRDGTWVQLCGELDLFSATEAEAAIASASAPGESLTIDLRGLEFIDSSGIALLVMTNRRRGGSPLTVVASAGPVTRLLELCGLDRQLLVIDGTAQ